MAQAARSQQDLYAASPVPDRTQTRDRAPDPLIGRVIADRYRIVGHLGRGGMGVVYKVEHLRIGKLMAMKLLTGELSRNREIVRRFKREALAASRLTSINTVQVWDFGHSDGLTYLVMELVTGEDLGKVLKREGPLPFHRIAQIAVQVCNSMAEAHERGIVHRDIKPENILVLHPSGGESDGESRERAEARQLTDLVKVLDFGLAKLHDEDRPHTNEVTTTGAIVGTPFYMSPEQIRGEAVDGRADIYALGAVMYRAVTGVPPFTAPTPMAVITQHLTEPLIPPHERAPELNIPREASDIIVKAMAKDREERYANAAELREALITHLATLGVSGGFLRSGALETLAATGTAEKIRPSRVDTEMDVPVATRREVNAYSVKRRRAGLIATAIALAVVAAVLIAARTMRSSAKGGHAPNEESEPNDTIANASALSLGAPSHGYIGKRIAPDRGDADFWSIDVPAGTVDPLLEIALAPLPNMPLCVDLFDNAASETPITTFCRPRGVPLHVEAFRVQPTRHWLRVSQDRTAHDGTGKPPVHENVSDTYALRVAMSPGAPSLEIEPNDGLAAAQLLTPGQSVNGTLGWRNDRDTFCATSGKLVVTDRGATPVSLEVFVDGVAKGRVTVENTWKSASLNPSQRTCVTLSTIGDSDDFYRVLVEAP